MAEERSFYVGPDKPRLRASSWNDIEIAAISGVLDETQWVELKRDVPASSKPANLELAKDLASLSVDGGLLIVGIADAKGALGTVTGTDLTDLATRIDQVAGNRIRPPLSVTLDSFPDPSDASKGVLVVTVPASESAPHMVEGRYWGRGATGKRVLSDDEVRRLLADRQRRSAGFEERLRALTGIDPWGPLPHDHGHMYVLCEPAGEPREPLSDVLDGNVRVQDLVVKAVPFRSPWMPSFGGLNYTRSHPDGLAATNASPDAATSLEQYELLVLLGDDGGLRLASGSGTQPYGEGADAPEVVSPGHVILTLHSCALLAAHVAQTYTGYSGPWRMGIYMDRLRDVVPSQAHSTVDARYGYTSITPFPADEYLRFTITTTQELAEAPERVVERLAKPLLKGLGVAPRFFPYEDPGDIERRS
jgi:hypothetical protein